MRFQIVGIENHAKTRVSVGLQSNDIKIYRTDVTYGAKDGAQDQSPSIAYSILAHLLGDRCYQKLTRHTAIDHVAIEEGAWQSLIRFRVEDAEVMRCMVTYLGRCAPARIIGKNARHPFRVARRVGNQPTIWLLTSLDSLLDSTRERVFTV